MQDEISSQGRRSSRTARAVTILPLEPQFQTIYHCMARHDRHTRYPATFNRRGGGPTQVLPTVFSP